MNARTHRSWLLLAALAALSGAGAARSEEGIKDAAQIGATGQDAPAVHEEQQGRLFIVDGRFYLDPPVTRAQAWSVLSDYGHLSEFVSSIRRSVVRGRRPDGAVVEQEAAGKWLFFSRSVSVLLDVREVFQRSITFHDVSHKDFLSYQGSWQIAQAGKALRVDYHLEAEPSAAIPDFVIKQVFSSDAKMLLEQIRAEILHRAQGVGGAPR